MYLLNKFTYKTKIFDKLTKSQLKFIIFSKGFCSSLKRDFWNDIDTNSEIQTYYEKLNPSEANKFLENSHLLQDKLKKKYSTKIKYIHVLKNNMHRFIVHLISSNKTLTIKGDFADKKQKAKKIAMSKLIDLLNEKKILSSLNSNFKFSTFLEEFTQSVVDKNEAQIIQSINRAKYENFHFQIENIDLLYNSLLFSLNFEFCEKIAPLIKSLKIAADQCISQDEEEYFSNQRFLLFFETLESIISSIEKNSEFTESDVEIISVDKDIYTVSPVNTRDRNRILQDSRISDTKDYDLIAKEDYILIMGKNKDEKILGEILSIDSENKIKVRCPNRLVNDPKDPDCKFITLKKITSSVTYDVFSKHLRIFTMNPKSSCEKIRKLIVSKNSDKFSDFKHLAAEKVFTLENDYIYKNECLTDAQKSAIKSAIENRLTLIQGPPGTGKTKTAAEIVREWLNVNCTNNPILVTADSNIAVDNIYNELQKIGIKALRVGSNSNARDFFSDTQNKKNIFGIIKKEIGNVQVICATLVGSNSQILDKLKFERVILDEAAQSTELSNLAVLNKHIKQLVIIGDHKQLRPTVQSTYAAKLDYGISLFEKLVNKGIGVEFLDVQYRMHPGISEFPSFHFYNNQIKTGISKDKRPLIPGFAWPNKDVPVAFINLKHSYDAKRGNSYINVAECEEIAGLVGNISLNLKEIGIITPYEAQKMYLKDLLNTQLRKNQRREKYSYPTSSYNVDTVDGFQGMEKELIIFSSVRSNKNKNIGFLKDPRRLNVMLTRARRGLIVVGNYDSLNSDLNWKEWIQWCEKNNLII